MEGLRTLGEIYFGKLDAYSECIEYGKDMYKSLFYACPSFCVEKFLDGSAYYIYGDKGSGKTALLKYIEIMAEDNGAYIEYVRFKKDIDEDERNDIKRSGIPNEPFEEIIESDVPSDFALNCIYAWQVYIIKCIINRTDGQSVFAKNNAWKRLKFLISAAYGKTDSIIKKITPKMKHGNMKIDIPPIGGLELEFDWMNKGGNIVSFHEYAKRVLELFSELEVDKENKNKCYILFDELELIHLKKKSYDRDIALIRDLVLAINYINECAKVKRYPVHVVACIRNEVYKSIASIGYEINKVIQDYGVEISWQQSGGSIYDHPLINMLKNRLYYSQLPDIQNQLNDPNEVLQYYFDDDVNIDYPRQTAANYIVDQTWSKPRDVIRLFQLIQKRYENAKKVTVAIFESVRKAYSSESWEEFSNELSAKYSQEEVGAIRQILLGMPISFTSTELKKKMTEKAEFFSPVKNLMQTKTSAELLQDLYRLGVVGTDSKWKRFYFKGDADFDPTAKCIIHYPLRRFFSSY